MFLDRLAHMQPLFLVAMVLCWSAVGAVVNLHSPDAISLPSLLAIGLATAALGVVSIRAQHAAWAQALVLRADACLERVRPTLFFIGCFSFLLSAWALVIVGDSLL
jgi:hypothetical protein